MKNDPIDITKEFKRSERRAKWRERFQKALDWCSEHKEIVIGGFITGMGLVTTGIKVGGRCYAQYMEHRNKDYRVYDTSLGKYWELNRKLKNSDWLQIERRRATGERLGEILLDLHALK